MNSKDRFSSISSSTYPHENMQSFTPCFEILVLFGIIHSTEAVRIAF